MRKTGEDDRLRFEQPPLLPALPSPGCRTRPVEELPTV